ncbi:MAG: carboxypeptidase-like regulatory domain-containing protein [Phycisphaerae bacterium]|nr:carboxypeptidase-like regulatory domain-containing protein [Phycisphaerae bacterium]
MKKAIISFVIFLSLPVFAIDYNDFPANMQQVLDERTDELISNGGILCVAGRVTMDDEAYINSGKDVKINFCQRVDEHLCVYDDGWFIMNQVFQPSAPKEPAKMFIRAFGYDPIDATIAVMQGEITYVEFVMHKTAYEKLASITGRIVNEQGEPVDGAKVKLSFPRCNRAVNDEPGMSTTTDSNGEYVFEDVSEAEYEILISAPGYAYITTRVKTAAGEITTNNLKLYLNRRAIIDYVYQADGSQSFTGGDIRTGTIEWVNGARGIDFSDESAEQPEEEQRMDIGIAQDGDTLELHLFYDYGENGFYDGGAVDFESVRKAAGSGYSKMFEPCAVGHVYVVKTSENNYAKFVVRSIFVE